MKVDYGDHGPITIADVMVIPAGRTIDLSLRSEGGGAHSTDGTARPQVIHSFWAPQLFGKQDVVPGAAATNHILFQADEPGDVLRAVRGVLRAAARDDEVPGRRA